MKHLVVIFFFLFSLIFYGCKKNKDELAFKTIVNLNVSDLSKKKVELTGSIVLVNNSEEALTYKTLVADVNIEGIDLNTFFNKNKSKINSKKEFIIPLKLTISPDDLIFKNNATAVVKIVGEVEYETEKAAIKTIRFSDKQIINIEPEKKKKVSKESEKSELNIELTKKELKKLKKQLKKGLIDEEEFENLTSK